jgi:hypothetical protein
MCAVDGAYVGKIDCQVHGETYVKVYIHKQNKHTHTYTHTYIRTRTSIPYRRVVTDVIACSLTSVDL